MYTYKNNTISNGWIILWIFENGYIVKYFIYLYNYPYKGGSKKQKSLTQSFSEITEKSFEYAIKILLSKVPKNKVKIKVLTFFFLNF